MAFRPDPKPEPKEKKKYVFPPRKPIAKQTAKNKQKRQIDRAGYPQFFKGLISAASEVDTRCDNCGSVLHSPNASNFAHILSKRLHVEVSTNPQNIIKLCGLWDPGTCHQDFDSSLSKRESMPVFKQAAQQIHEIRHLVINQSKEIDQIDQFLKTNQ